LGDPLDLDRTERTGGGAGGLIGTATIGGIMNFLNNTMGVVAPITTDYIRGSGVTSIRSTRPRSVRRHRAVTAPVARIESGWVQVNQGLGQQPGHSYGGYKQSDIRREFWLEGMLYSFTQRKNVTVTLYRTHAFAALARERLERIAVR
jgi:hypothetical protein